MVSGLLGSCGAGGVLVSGSKGAGANACFCEDDVGGVESGECVDRDRRLQCSEHGLFLKRADVSSTGGGAGMINGPDQWLGAGILGGPDMPGGRDLPGERDLLMSKSSKWRPIWGRFFALD